MSFDGAGALRVGDAEARGVPRRCRLRVAEQLGEHARGRVRARAREAHAGKGADRVLCRDRSLGPARVAPRVGVTDELDQQAVGVGQAQRGRRRRSSAAATVKPWRSRRAGQRSSAAGGTEKPVA
ncbi:MAG: hypothetical protein U5K43_07535 [Halofilum sp. (in: g-proteobacteria)]|nr:hypothetical protein [Halofilum sp. (in: g-proteobacteria)]